jgi:mRNA interferase MazF
MTRGDVVIVDLDPVRGSEAAKRRPCVIVSNDANNRAGATLTVLPITNRVARVYPFDVLLSDDPPLTGKVQANQIRTVAKGRVVGAPIARLAPTTMRRVDAALRLHLELGER